MYHIKDDIRQQKTAWLIIEKTLTEKAAKEHPHLTISDICRDSGVSRSTFYRLFDEPDDVMRFYADNLFASVLEEIAGQEDVNPFHVYARRFAADAGKILALMQYGKVGIFMDSSRRMLTRYAPVLFPEMDTESEEFAFFVEMRTGVLVGALRAWHRTGQKASEENVIKFAEEQLKKI